MVHVNQEMILIFQFLQIQNNLGEEKTNTIIKYILDNFSGISDINLVDELFYFKKHEVYNNSPPNIFAGNKSNEI